MKETILQIIRDYAPVVLCFILMFIDKFGFGAKFASFLGDVKSTCNINALKSELEKVRADLRAEADELKDVREEIKKEREAITRIKGAK